QRRDGSLPTGNIKMMSDVIEFCKQRKEFCFNGTVVPQVGVLFSNEIFRNVLIKDFLYSEAGLNDLKEMTKIVLDDQYSPSIVMNYDTQQTLASFPVIIVPGWYILPPDVVKKLTDYASNGGNLLVVGATAVKQFASVAGVSLTGPAQNTVEI